MKGLSQSAQIEIFKTAFESSYDGIHILDKDGWTLYINEACTRIEGISYEEAVNKNIRQLVKCGVYSESVTLKVLETNGPVTIIQTTKNGKQVLATGTPIFKNGEIDKIVVNSRDITDLNALKRELSAKEEQANRYKEELSHLRKEQFKAGEIVAQSESMDKIVKLAMTVAKVDSTILITGESGVGKGVMGRFIHNHSERQGGPFIKIDCGAIPESLFESELFGYEKGAFTGAGKEGKIGLLELAENGTLFFDEIGEMPLSMQPKLLLAIQDKEIRKVGGKEVKSLNVRIIAATNVDLAERVKQKQFREDLYYRLNVIPIHIPPLRERKEDILPLITVLLKNINERYGWSKKFSKEVIGRMMRYTWLGNVRELENFIERMMVSTEREWIDLAEMPVDLLEDGPSLPELEYKNYKEAAAAFDHRFLRAAIEKAGSVSAAAKELEIDATTIRRKLQKHCGKE